MLVSSAENQIYQQLALIGQQIDQSDVFMYLTNSVNYLSTSYALPTSRKKFNSLFFNGVREYELPSDFGTLIEPQRPPALWSPDFRNTTDTDLAHWPHGRLTSVQYDGVTPFLEVSDSVDSSAFLIDSCDDDDNVTLSGDGSGLSVDNMIYTQGTGSLRFTITPATGQTVLTFAIDSFDITDFLTKNWCFLDIICPSTNTSDLTSVVLRLGSSASAYYEMTATETTRGAGIEAGISQLGFDLTAATETGTVTDTAIDYMQVIINYGLTGTGGVYHVDNVFSAQGVYFQVPYYSKYNILAAGTTPTDTITGTSDVIMLPVECDEAIIYKALELIAASPNVSNENFANFCARELKPKEDLLNSLYPSERALVSTTWYRPSFKRARYWM